MALVSSSDPLSIIVADRNAEVELYKTKVASSAAPASPSKKAAPSASPSTYLCGHSSTVITDVGVTNDGKFLLSSDRNEKIRVAFFPNSYEIQSFCLGHTAFVTQIVQPHGKGYDDVMITGSGDGTIKLWHYYSGKLLSSASLDSVVGTAVEVVADKGDGAVEGHDEGVVAVADGGGEEGEGEGEEGNDKNNADFMQDAAELGNVVSKVVFDAHSGRIAVALLGRSVVAFYHVSTSDNMFHFVGSIDAGSVVYDIAFDDEGKLFVLHQADISASLSVYEYRGSYVTVDSKIAKSVSDHLVKSGVSFRSVIKTGEVASKADDGKFRPSKVQRKY
jgi:WD40 repeat protein